ncbi:SPX domain-containing membrane protein OsI [Seminavis robusta]|uniref:SPX domain-containing membrane protein OsI n=1 Tax=Seminavis robusta TaxID=568900 RepID=A0A9N8EX73_9STRA|nr:SPX domain-containing membrane protein OsI [Seminavis robusta]|eukprot:Sro2637_g333310.1 SPX domain-containing membrane protein OsI (888) ;mRNA; f:1357-4408
MVQFGKKLLANRYEPWVPYYLDYQGLKGCLGRLKKSQKLLQQQQLPSSRSIINHIEVPPPPPEHDHVSYQNSSHHDQLELGSPPAHHHYASSPLVAGSPMSYGSPQLSRDSHSEHTLATQLPSKEDRRDFETFLEDEVEKIGLFFLQIQGEISAKLGQVRKQQFEFLRDWELQPPPAAVTTHNGVAATALVESGFADQQDAKFQQFYSDYHGCAVQLLHLIHFVESNVTGIRKILKKHDKVTKQHLTYQYLSFNVHHKDLKHLWTSLLLRQYEGITVLNATLKVALTELKNMERSQLLQAQPEDRLSLSLAHPGDLLNNNKEAPKLATVGKPPLNPKQQRHQPAKSMPNILLSPEDIAAAVVSGNLQPQSMTPSVVSTKKQPLYETTLTGRELDAMLLKIEAARRRLNISSTTFQDMLAAQIVMLEPTSMDVSEDGMEDDEASKAVEDKWLSHFLNLMSTFLYMTNYYVVAPTSGRYAEIWWTSYSYKSALVFASTCSIVGNLFYALGLPCQSLTFVMIGRLLNGFGSARSINRRALGMAAGPAIASLLHIGYSESSDDRIGSLHMHTEETFVGADGVTTTTTNDDVTVLGTTTNVNPWWTPENSPGWVLFVVWSVFLVLLLLHFEDPPKHSSCKQAATEPAPSNAIENGATPEEKKALLGDKQEERDTNLGSFDSDVDSPVEVPLWKNIPVMTTFVIYFILKLILECILSSTSTLTNWYFKWDSSVSGIYLAILGLLMLPANLGISILARKHDDRELIFGCEVAMLVGCCGIIQYTEATNYTPIQYVLFSVVIFLSTNGLEGPNMSLLSKTIPKSWSRGIFNVGLLATEAGTFGRAVGDLLLSAWGFEGVGTLLNHTFRTMSICSAFSLALTMYFYEDLEPHEQDD